MFYVKINQYQNKSFKTFIYDTRKVFCIKFPITHVLFNINIITTRDSYYVLYVISNLVIVIISIVLLINVNILFLWRTRFNKRSLQEYNF